MEVKKRKELLGLKEFLEIVLGYFGFDFGLFGRVFGVLFFG